MSLNQLKTEMQNAEKNMNDARIAYEKAQLSFYDAEDKYQNKIRQDNLDKFISTKKRLVLVYVKLVEAFVKSTFLYNIDGTSDMIEQNFEETFKVHLIDLYNINNNVIIDNKYDNSYPEINIIMEVFLCALKCYIKNSLQPTSLINNLFNNNKQSTPSFADVLDNNIFNNNKQSTPPFADILNSPVFMDSIKQISDAFTKNPETIKSFIDLANSFNNSNSNSNSLIQDMLNTYKYVDSEPESDSEESKKEC